MYKIYEIKLILVKIQMKFMFLFRCSCGLLGGASNNMDNVSACIEFYPLGFHWGPLFLPTAQNTAGFSMLSDILYYYLFEVQMSPQE